ncbi:hypothetical protein NHM04_08165 [Gilvimarinus sp. DA14]|nr:hypothetical protein NHM04_08165 [Gilvimarinus sp. DA14]
MAAIAIPSYLESVRKSNRADAKASLTNAAHQMQRCYTLNNTFTDCPMVGTTTSAEEFYNIEVTVTDGGAGFTATATPAKAPQTGDSDCTSMTLNNLGQKDATPDNDGRCW